MEGREVWAYIIGFIISVAVSIMLVILFLYSDSSQPKERLKPNVNVSAPL